MVISVLGIILTISSVVIVLSFPAPSLTKYGILRNDLALLLPTLSSPVRTGLYAQCLDCMIWNAAGKPVIRL